MIPFLLVTLLVCGSGELFCPMEGSAAGSHHSESNPQQLPPAPFNSSGDCPDQLKSSEEQSRDLAYGILPIVAFTQLADIFEANFSYALLSTLSVPRFSSYPLLFLLFSVFLN